MEKFLAQQTVQMSKYNQVNKLNMDFRIHHFIVKHYIITDYKNMSA